MKTNPSLLLHLKAGLRAFALVASASLAGLSTAHATDADALLNALIKKGILSEKDAAKIQEESAVTEKQSSANKIKLSNSLTELRLYGDIRMRYQYDNTDFQVDPLGDAHDRSPSGNQRSRLRLRLRLNADFKLGQDWFGGVELQTGYASDSANQTFENGFTDYPIFISKAFLGYSPTDWLTVVAGKQPNPFYTTELIYDPDINPSGFTETIAFHKLFSTKSSGGLDKDGKQVAAAPATSPWEVTLNAGQFVFDDNIEGGGRDPGTRDHDATSDAWLFHTQLVASYRFNPNLRATVAPGWMVYTAGSVSIPSGLTSNFGDFNSVNFQDSALVSGATRNLSILNAPGDVSFKLGKIPGKVYWDVAYNIDGRSRALDTYRLPTHSTRDDFAWLAGFQVGENRKKGDLSFLANWRETGISSVDPNLNDNEFALGFLNTKGYRFTLSYNLSDFAVFSVNYYGAWNMNRSLVGGEATSGNAIANANAAQTLQVDLNVKF